MTTNFFSPLSFVAVFGSAIRDKHPGSATLPTGTDNLIPSDVDPDPDLIRIQ